MSERNVDATRYFSPSEIAQGGFDAKGTEGVKKIVDALGGGEEAERVGLSFECAAPGADRIINVVGMSAVEGVRTMAHSLGTANERKRIGELLDQLDTLAGRSGPQYFEGRRNASYSQQELATAFSAARAR